MNDPREGADELLGDLALKQRNIQPHDIIANDGDVDDILWNGPRANSGIQKAGNFLLGSTLVFSSVVVGITFAQKGARILLTPMIAICTFGLRIVYKSLRPSNRGRKSQ